MAFGLPAASFLKRQSHYLYASRELGATGEGSGFGSRKESVHHPPCLPGLAMGGGPPDAYDRRPTKAGMERAEAGGKRLGRPASSEDKVIEAKRLKGEGLSVRAIAVKMGLSRSRAHQLIQSVYPANKSAVL